MRSAWRTLDSATLRAVVVMSLSVLVIGTSYGVAAHGAGLTLWQIVLIATIVLAGSSEFVFVGILAAGGVPILAALAGLLVNTRNFGYGLAVGKHLRGTPEILLGSHLINDETAALATAETDPRRARAAFLLCGLGVLISWPVGAALGAALGGVVADPASLGLDAAFPALLAALAIPALRDGATWAAVTVGAAVAVSSTPFLPAGLPIMGALGGFAALEVVRRLRSASAEAPDLPRTRTGADARNAEPNDTLEHDTVRTSR
ncbi:MULTISPECIES: AzlC family ABC transporter permease [unclassified Gordonia (in: high G+C Gram-positive bacteria)]|uniref:AzlC family ABC transporter permease n=1 Tax=Gordonia TaxID=2053 RepID=UPI000990D5CC|nr:MULTISPECIES: AzlC family ABC transporter permease [unclassified Gordonia (in: high G+C Gram-positive bacteria)]MBN0974343.1 AzlC family ABC transporter permease [Gordonia sp. BP-119]MBN0981439.1 AzlC family ABC transporter permease [Gordonia sp. BP-94]MBR7190991.1 AzlC family ABC transporter permease [Gordonia sp. SCSIO 19800]MCX2753058.1 AzlC family ABC transporter permease [Gordonia sp. 4N]MDT0221327.1 AzlC family ABC transporter permease [Gordonia sp. AC31]